MWRTIGYEEPVQMVQWNIDWQMPILPSTDMLVKKIYVIYKVYNMWSYWQGWSIILERLNTEV